MTDDDWKYLRAKVDEIRDHQAEANIILARNTDSLEEHMKRTAALESRITPIEKHVTGISYVVATVVAAVPLAIAAHTLGLF